MKIRFREPKTINNTEPGGRSAESEDIMTRHKAQYVGKVYDKNGYDVHLFYRYRGYEYLITKYGCETNETLRAQHKNEQERIDKIIEEKKTKKSYRYEDTVDYAIEHFLKMVDG